VEKLSPGLEAILIEIRYYDLEISKKIFKKCQQPMNQILGLSLGDKALLESLQTHLYLI